MGNAERNGVREWGMPRRQCSSETAEKIPVQYNGKGQLTPAQEESYTSLTFNFYFHYHFITSDSTRRTNCPSSLTIQGKMSFVDASTEITEDTDVEPELRNTRIAPAATLMVGTAVLTQLMVLSGVAIIMGVAVVTMCAFIAELVVLTIVATALERGVFSFEDLGHATEIAATLLFTVTTVALAAFGNGKYSEGTPVIDAASIAALKL